MKYLALTFLSVILIFGADSGAEVTPVEVCGSPAGVACPAQVRARPSRRAVRKSPQTARAAQAQSLTFVTGQAARMMIGQTSFTSADTAAPSASLLGAVGGLAYANNTLFVVDSNKVQATPVQNRVLIYNNLSSFILPPTSDIPQGLRCPVCFGPDSRGADLVVGQPDFTSNAVNVSRTGFRTPTNVATDGKIMVVADSENNRVLIWKTIPTSNNAPADIVLGQPDFTTANAPPKSPTASSFRGPQGVWVQNGRLYVADTQNHRIVVWNSIPTSNNQAADFVLGEPNLNTAPPNTAGDVAPQANTLFSPVSVTSDGQRLFVADLAHNRVLIWNSIPTQNQQPADVEVGQPDMTSETANNVLGSCVANGTDSDNNPTYPSGCTSFCPYTGMDSDNNPTYPRMCGKTLNFPRFALSDGQRLYIADGGNDRILVYNSIPTQNGQAADAILGQVDEFTDQVTDTSTSFFAEDNLLFSSPNTIRTPLALAWDGANLYAADPFDRRVLVFTPGQSNVPLNGINNSASQAVYAIGTINIGGTTTSGDIVTVTINGTDYKYTVLASDSLTSIVEKLVDLINGKSGGTPDPNVVATANTLAKQIIVSARTPGSAGDNITYSATVAGPSSTAVATETATAIGATLNGGGSAAEVGPGTLITITGVNLSDVPSTGVAGTPDSQGYYPSTLGGVEVYFDGIKAPLLFVSPTQINTQLPFEVQGSNGVTAFVRTVHSDGSITATTAISVPVVPQHPGIFADAGTDPRPGMVYHTSSRAIAIVSVDGSILANDLATVTIEDRNYSYTIQSTDTLATIRDGLIALINANPDEKVTASPSGQFTRIVLTAKVSGPDGNGIPVSVTENSNGLVLLTALNPTTCCANVSGARVTADNPAVPGEVLALYATGLGPATLADLATPAGATGQIYKGPAFNVPVAPVDNAQLGTTTANVLSSGLLPGTAGVYEVTFQISTTLPTNPNTQLFIAQSVFTSNIVTIAVQAP